jgi:hypothetical protein
LVTNSIGKQQAGSGGLWAPIGSIPRMTVGSPERAASHSSRGTRKSATEQPLPVRELRGQSRPTPSETATAQASNLKSNPLPPLSRFSDPAMATKSVAAASGSETSPAWRGGVALWHPCALPAPRLARPDRAHRVQRGIAFGSETSPAWQSAPSATPVVVIKTPARLADTEGKKSPSPRTRTHATRGGKKSKQASNH